jgi:integrase
MSTDSQPSTSRPAPTTARIELPDASALALHNIDLPLESARLVLVALSSVIARSRSKTAGNVSQMTSGVVACCRVEAVRDGEITPAAHPDLRATGWPAGGTAMRRLGIERGDIEAYWARARTRSSDACLPVSWVLAFVPAPLWAAILTVIEWGPEEAAARLEDAVIELAEQPVARATRRRSAGNPISAGTIRTRVTAVHQLFSALVELRTRALTRTNSGLPRELLDAWVAKPERPDLDRCGAHPARLDTSGPSFAALQEMIDQLDREVADAKPRSRYLRLRRRAVAGLIVAHGPRVNALRQLDAADYLPNFTFSDGATGPAIVYRPGKTRHADETHIVAISAELAGWLEEWITYTGREIGEADSPMWPSRKPVAGRPIMRLNDSAFARMISGHTAPDGTGSRPLVPRGDNPYIGFNAHAYRHSAYQIARRAGAQVLLENPLAYAHLTPDDFARAVVGHGLIRSTGDIYRDLDQQVLARLAVERAWSEIRSRPTPSALDPAAITDACTRIEILWAALSERNAERVEIESAKRALVRAQTTLDGAELATAVLESNALVFRLARLQTEIADLGERLDAAQRDLDHALTHEVPLSPSDLNGYDELLASAQVLASTTRARVEGDGLCMTARQMADVLGVSVKAINVWIREGIPERRPKVWRPGAWTINDRGIRVLPLALLDGELLTPIQRERLHVLRLGLLAAIEQSVNAAA